MSSAPSPPGTPNPFERRLTPEEFEAIKARPLPHELDQMISQARGRFLAQVSALWDQSIQPLTFTFKLLDLTRAQKAAQKATTADEDLMAGEPPAPKNRPPSKAMRRSRKARAASQKKEKS